jgi:histone-lysine N-methyltransferase SETMAR
VYNNVERKRSWGGQGERPLSTTKAELHQKRAMLCIWWDWKGILYYDFLPRNQAINSDVYCSQLDRLKAAIDQKRPEFFNRKSVVFHHDNARPHAFLATRQKLMQLGWDVLPHMPYSPDLAPSDYHLFRSLQNSLNGKNFISPEACKNHLEQFFARKTRKFYMDETIKLPERWLKVIEKKWFIRC